MWIQLHQCCFCIKCRYCHLKKQLWKGKNVHHFSKTFITYCVYLTHLATWKATVLMTSDHLCKLDGYGGYTTEAYFYIWFPEVQSIPQQGRMMCSEGQAHHLLLCQTFEFCCVSVSQCSFSCPGSLKLCSAGKAVIGKCRRWFPFAFCFNGRSKYFKYCLMILF